MSVELFGAFSCCFVGKNEERMLRKVFGSKREGVTGGCGRLHNDELHNLPFLILLGV
jgi:hypothetical protein